MDFVKEYFPELLLVLGVFVVLVGIVQWGIVKTARDGARKSCNVTVIKACDRAIKRWQQCVLAGFSITFAASILHELLAEDWSLHRNEHILAIIMWSAALLIAVTTMRGLGVPLKQKKP